MALAWWESVRDHGLPDVYALRRASRTAPGLSDATFGALVLAVYNAVFQASVADVTAPLFCATKDGSVPPGQLLWKVVLRSAPDARKRAQRFPLVFKLLTALGVRRRETIADAAALAGVHLAIVSPRGNCSAVYEGGTTVRLAWPSRTEQI